jgi:hypothetical protein
LNKTFLLALMMAMCQMANAEESKPAEQSGQAEPASVRATSKDIAPPVRPAEDDVVQGTRIRMKHPDSYVLSKDFAGFANVSANSSIMVTELPAPFALATAGFTEAGLASKGMKLLSKAEIQVGDLPGQLVAVEQKAYGLSFRKWINAFGNSEVTFVVTATYPEEKESELAEKLKAVVITARFDPSLKNPSPEDTVPFTISGGSKYKVAGVLQGTLMLTPSGKLAASTGKTSSAFVVGKALGTIPVTDKIAFAKARLMQTSKVTGIEIVSERDEKIDGMPAREIVATAKEANDSNVLIYLTLVYPSESYFIMQGMSELTDQKSQVDEFRAIAKSFKLKAK